MCVCGFIFVLCCELIGNIDVRECGYEVGGVRSVYGVVLFLCVWGVVLYGMMGVGF